MELSCYLSTSRYLGNICRDRLDESCVADEIVGGDVGDGLHSSR